MAVSNQFPAVALLLLLPLTQVLAQSTTECSVENENPTIDENNQLGAIVTTITMQPGVTVTIENSPDSGSFTIIGTELSLTKSLDYEAENVLLVTLLCWKGGVEVNSVNVVVEVGNLNDNSPTFKETNITAKIPEDTKVNTIIIPEKSVTASDLDLDNIQYELTAITPEATDYFNIQGINNPSIYLHKTLDYEKYKFMQLILYARDRAPGSADGNTATATINIDIQQADTKPPWFQPCTFLNADKKVCISSGYIGRVNISEKMTEPLILKPGPLYAIDPDYTLNEKIVYSIVDGNKDDVFLLNSDTGNITMNKAGNTTDTFILHVMATQANNALRYSFTTVEIKVIAKNSHAPYFENSRYTGTVSAGLATLSLVMDSKAPSIPLKIFAADDDFPNKLNPQITYSIQNSSDFTVTRDGLVLTNIMLQSAATITVLATATDEESLQEANTVITVEVTPSTGTKGTRANLQYTAQDMAALGATLAVLLVIALLLLGLIVSKHYANTIKHLVGKESDKDPPEDLSNQSYQDDENPVWSTKDNESLRSDTLENGTPVGQQPSDGFLPLEPRVESSIATASAATKGGEEDKEGKDTDSNKEVKSILTKDRKTVDDGYKAVWFKDDIDPDTKDDVVVIEDQVEEEDDSDGDGDRNEEDEDEDDEQGSQHGDPVVSFILERAQLQATNGNLKPDQDADTEDDILL
ncbi:cadherin-related family member 5 isoform X3 [Chelonia mydas]|uniref:cadherin-related family member 5 isoform X3 n=1 Tax=Chelonia mydas TaxID=8469 RepID=UPI0018A24548|nr:cadherin-related family member 5 isoform X3 [Chelonia mydas]